MDVRLMHMIVLSVAGRFSTKEEALVPGSLLVSVGH